MWTWEEKGYSRNVARNIAKIALKHGGMPLTGYVTRSWEKGRFNDPYLRDTLMDFLAEHDLPERVRMVCHTEAAAEVYRQTWNLWYAGDRDDRMR